MRGSGNHLGGYSFRLSDVAAAPLLTPGTTVTGTLGDPAMAAAQTHVSSTAPITYSSGSNGAAQFSSGNNYLTVSDFTSLKPTQITLEAWVYADARMSSFAGIVAKTTSGSWTDGYALARFSDGTINFFVNNYQSGSVGVALPTGVWTHVAGVYNGSALQLYLNGSLVASKAYSTPISNTTAPLRIGSAAGEYNWIGTIDDVRVWNIARTAADIAAGMGSPLTGTETGLAAYWKLDEGSGLNFIDSSGHGNSAVLANAPAVESKLYSLQANAGDPFYFDAQSLSGGGSTNWRLIDPYGQQVWSQGFSNVATTVLQSTGTYTLLVEGSVSNTSAVNYSFNAQKIVNPTTALTLGSLTTGVVTQPGQQNRYTFTLANASQLYFDLLTNDPGLTWSLSGPRGFEASARFDLADAQNNSAPAISLLAGDYTLTIAATGDHTGGYGFRLSDLAAVATVTPGTAVSGTLGDFALAVALTRTGFAAPIAYSSGTNRAAQFSNNYLTVSDSASLKPAQITVEAWVYADPRMSSWNGVAVKTTSSSWNDGYGLARYPDGTINFFVNSYITGAVGTTLPTGVWTHVAGVYNGSTLQLYLNGSLVASKAYSTAISHTTAPLRIGSGANDYQWIGSIDDVRIWNTARTATDIAANMGSPLAGTETGLAGYWQFDEAGGPSFLDDTGHGNNAALANAPATESKLYSFQATAGDQFYFDAQSATGSGQFYWRLIDPYGRVQWGQSFTDVATQVMPFTGRYSLLVEGAITNTSAITYTFNVQKITNTTAALSLDSVVNDAITQTGQQKSYTFNLAGASQLYFDSLTNDGNLTWTLVGPQGTEVSSRSFTASDCIGHRFQPGPEPCCRQLHAYRRRQRRPLRQLQLPFVQPCIRHAD